jgi:hypothetical protein
MKQWFGNTISGSGVSAYREVLACIPGDRPRLKSVRIAPRSKDPDIPERMYQTVIALRKDQRSR